MAIQFDVLKELPSGLERKSVFVMMTDTDTGEKKQLEITKVPADVDDIETWITSNPSIAPRRLFRDPRATAVDVTMVNQSRERGLAGYYRDILDAIATSVASGGGLDDLLAVARSAIMSNARGRAQVEQYTAALGLSNQPETIAEKRDLLLAVEHFALKGILKG